jgi:hypothetical protein
MLRTRLHCRNLPDNFPASEIASRKAKLISLVERIVERITCTDSVMRMPREIRVIAGYISMFSAVHAPEAELPLIGGFIMLRFVVRASVHACACARANMRRFFSPAIAAPEGTGLLSVDDMPSIKARRNLVLITKVLQVAITAHTHTHAHTRTHVHTHCAQRAVELTQTEHFERRILGNERIVHERFEGDGRVDGNVDEQLFQGNFKRRSSEEQGRRVD